MGTGSSPPDSKATGMTVPPEILDKILEHIPPDEGGRPTLVACALVATWWTGPSQRRLFSSVTIGERNYRRWMNGVVHSGSKAHLLGYVRSLSHYRNVNIKKRHRMRDLPRDSGEYLSALRNLHSLRFYNIFVGHISGEQFHTCFSAFRETLTHLTLEAFAISFSAFVTLVDYFPNIATLDLGSFVLEPDEGSVPPLSRPLRGKLHIYYPRSDSLEFLNRFAKLDLEYEELVIETNLWILTEIEFVESALQISASTVKFLRLAADPESEDAVTIHNFRRLRELELVVGWPGVSHRTLFASITSTELRKIIFPTSYMQDDWMVFVQGTEAQTLADQELCELVDRLCAMGYCHTLEVELRLKIGGDPEYDFTRVLPEFRERGVVTIIDTADGNRLLHSSTRNR